MAITSVYGFLSECGNCPFCKTALASTGAFIIQNIEEIRPPAVCPLCGFWFQITDVARHYPEAAMTEMDIATLRSFDINSSQVAFDEIGTHFRRNPEAMHQLNPRRFEEFVEDVFRNNGFTTQLTQATRDGGYDISIRESAVGELCLVECKRYSRNNPVSVSVVRSLLGVQVHQGAKRAKIVTTSTFTGPAKEFAAEISEGVSGYELELIDASRILTLLGAYNADLPPLHLNPRLFGADGSDDRH